MCVWAASLLFYNTTYTFCMLLRWFVNRCFRRTNFKIVNVHLIGTIQVCAPTFDVNAILEHYGLTGVLVEIAFIELCNVLLLRDAFADPCQLFDRYAKSRFCALLVDTLLGVQFVGAYASYFIACASRYK